MKSRPIVVLKIIANNIMILLAFSYFYANVLIVAKGKDLSWGLLFAGIMFLWYGTSELFKE